MVVKFGKGTEVKGVRECMLTEIFGVKRDEITEEWRKLHYTELHALYSSPNIIRNLKSRLRWSGHVARIEISRNEGKRPLGRPCRRWKGNIKVDLREVGCHPGNWMDLAQDMEQ